MKRNWGDALLILSLALLRALTAPNPDEDEEEESADVATGLVYYFSNRLYREQAAFNAPTEMLFEMQTLGDLTPVGVSALADIGKMTYQLAGAPFAEEDNSTFFYQSDKEGRYEAGDSKGVVHFWRMFPYLRSVYTFEHPYDAAASYEYGRNIKAR